MSFEEFQNRARLYVIGALENGESREFEEARASSVSRPRISSPNAIGCMKPSLSACARRNRPTPSRSAS